jgi:hypothetical protein
VPSKEGQTKTLSKETLDNTKDVSEDKGSEDYVLNLKSEAEQSQMSQISEHNLTHEFLKGRSPEHDIEKDKTRSPNVKHPRRKQKNTPQPEIDLFSKEAKLNREKHAYSFKQLLLVIYIIHISYHIISYHTIPSLLLLLFILIIILHSLINLYFNLEWESVFESVQSVFDVVSTWAKSYCAFYYAFLSHVLECCAC